MPIQETSRRVGIQLNQETNELTVSTLKIFYDGDTEILRQLHHTSYTPDTVDELEDAAQLKVLMGWSNG